MGVNTHVLVVDDDQLILDLLEKGLTRCGYRVTTENSGAMAVETAKRDKTIDLMIADLVMPDMNGVQLIKDILAHRKIPIILMTGHIKKTAQIIQGLQAGAVSYHTKPMKFSELTMGIEEAILKYSKANSPYEEQKSILIVDDESHIRDIGEAYFKKKDYKVLTAANHTEAFRAMRNDLVSIVLLDQHLPNGMQGHEIAGQIKKRYPYTKVAMFSGAIKLENINQLLDVEMPIDEFIDKGNWDDLFAQIDPLCEKRIAYLQYVKQYYEPQKLIIAAMQGSGKSYFCRLALQINPLAYEVPRATERFLRFDDPPDKKIKVAPGVIVANPNIYTVRFFHEVKKYWTAYAQSYLDFPIQHGLDSLLIGGTPEAVVQLKDIYPSADIIYLYASPKTAYSRISNRGGGEMSDLSIDQLTRQYHMYDELLTGLLDPIIRICNDAPEFARNPSEEAEARRFEGDVSNVMVRLINERLRTPLRSCIQS